MKQQILISSLILLAVAGLARADDLPYKEGELMVRFVDTGPEAPIRRVISGPLSTRAVKNVLSNVIIAGAAVRKEYRIVPELSLIKLPAGTTVQDSLVRFSLSPSVLYAGPNYKYKLCQPPRPRNVPDDPRFSSNQWGMDNAADTDIDAPEAWDIETGGSDIVVAVIDTGVDYEHPELAPNMWVNPIELAGADDADDDENGYVDDKYGYDFAGDDVNTPVPDGDPADGHYHGTHVAGIIGAQGNNGTGIAGVCWSTRIMALKVFADNGNSVLVADAISAIEYAVYPGSGLDPANIINASWGGYGDFPGLYEAIQAAGNAGILFVAAAGNYGDGSAIYPARYNLDNIISVMATDQYDRRSVHWDEDIPWASNYGATSVDIAAPGSDILSTFPSVATSGMDDEGITVTHYGTLGGTSMATPHVAGACALMWVIDHDLSCSDIKKMLLHPYAVDHITELEGLCVSEGRLNLYNVLNMAAERGRVRNVTKSTTHYTIQDAIDAADSSGNELIAQADRWYFERIDFHSKDLTLRSGDTYDTSDANIWPDFTFISGLFDSGTEVTINNGQDASTDVNGFTIVDANAGGSGIHCDGTSPTIRNCRVSWNTGSGGGISCEYSSAPTISNCRIVNNLAYGGGGISCYHDSDPNISGCTISDNRAYGDGGGIHFYNGSDANITNCTIIDNVASGDGGGIYCGDFSPVIITGSTISGNEADGEGGGIYGDNSSGLDINGCTISGNTSGYFDIYDYGGGGGIYCANSLSEIFDCAITGNEAVMDGGGMYVDTASPTVTNCQITDNISYWDGGGIYFFYSSDANIRDCNISENICDYAGGGIFCYESSPLIKNCLILENIADGWDGGAIALDNSSPEITNCTFVGNYGTSSSAVAGALYCAKNSDPNVTNCIFSDNDDIAIYEYVNPYYPALEPDANITYCLFYDNRDGDYYDEDDGVVRTFSGVDPNGNIGGKDPMFVTGRLGDYYLSQYQAGQILDVNGVPVNDPNVNPEDVNSPAVNAGSDTAISLGMDLYSTRTDTIDDSGTVDIGYHYDDPQPAYYYNLTIYVSPGESGRVSFLDPGGNDVNTSASDFTVYGYVQYAQVFLEVKQPDPNYPNYQFKSWSGTDDDTRTEANNVVTMRSDRFATAVFETIMIELRVRVSAGSGSIEKPPRGWGMYRRGKIVPLEAIPTDLSNAIIWSGTNDDYCTLSENTVTMLTNPQIVEVEFYALRTLRVGAQADYTEVQHAINDAHNRDIVMLLPGDWRGPFSIWGKGITLTSQNPDDPCVVATTVLHDWVDLGNVGPDTVVTGLTIKGAHYVGNSPSTPEGDGRDGPNGGSIYGGGMEIHGSASPTIRNVVIEDCSVRGGNGAKGNEGLDETGWFGNGGWAGGAYGGAVSIGRYGSPTFENCKFINCYAIGGNGGAPGCHGGVCGWPGSWGTWPTHWLWEYGPYENYWYYSGYGGAIHCDVGSSPTFIDCIITGNRSEGGVSGNDQNIENYGGAIYCAGGSTAKFASCEISDNTADTSLKGGGDIYISYGGAVACSYEGGARPLFEDCTFSGGLACMGGAVYAEKSEPLFDNCTFTDNSAYYGGGALIIDGLGKFARSDFSDNAATGIFGQGGAICSLGANVMIVDCDISNNFTVGSGGGIYISNKDIYGIEITGDNTVLVKNCLITGNSAGRDGGGISATWHSDPNIVNCTIAYNVVTGITGLEQGYGGGLYSSYGNYTNVINSIIWGNLGASGSQIAVGSGNEYDPRPSTVNVTYSDIQIEDVYEPNVPSPADALTVTVTDDAEVLANNILGLGINLVGEPMYTGAAVASGTFIGGLAAGIGIESGIILTSGEAELALPPNVSDGITGDSNLPGDPELDELIPGYSTNDAAILEFSFTSKGGNLFFNYAFASDEYNEYTNSPYNDVFGFFVDGTNIALIPGTTTPVAINNVNGGNPLGTDASNSHLYNNNDLDDGGPYFDIEYDGFTAVFTATVLNVGVGTHTIKLAIADASDYFLDSAVFIQAGSFSDKPITGPPIYIEELCTLNWWNPDSNSWDPNSNNIEDDPCFVGGYYLMQTAAGQLEDSNCVDVGSADANSLSLSMYRHTTRTDWVIDGRDPCAGPNDRIVDMGYHYVLNTYLVGDLDFDGDVDNNDVLILVPQHWLEEGCEFPDWCGGADLNQDGIVNFIDYGILTYYDYGTTETTAPVPDPMTWAVVPYSLLGETWISMTATRATDNYTSPAEVKYYFERTDANGNPDGSFRVWGPNSTYIDSGLVAGTEYGYRVKARDEKGNETGWSVIKYAKVGQDKVAPTPDPLTWAIVPHATSLTSIHMVATTATDESGIVEYYFDCTGGGGHDSDWQGSPEYEDTGLDPNTTYTYRVRARDEFGNTGGYSTSASAMTSEEAVLTPPSIDPNDTYQYSKIDPNNGYTYHYHHIAAIVDEGSAVVEYRFICQTNGGFSSDWQAENTYDVYVGAFPHSFRWAVQGRDENYNETALSEGYLVE